MKGNDSHPDAIRAVVRIGDPLPLARGREARLLGGACPGALGGLVALFFFPGVGVVDDQVGQAHTH